MSEFMKRVLTVHWLITFLLMGVFGALFGSVSLNIVALLHSNFSLVLEHGAMAFKDGALVQLLQLAGYGYLSVIFWLLFKACEHVLIQKMVH
jgi:hypothetical protein